MKSKVLYVLYHLQDIIHATTPYYVHLWANPLPALVWMFPYLTQWRLLVFMLRVLGRIFVGGVVALEEELTRVRRVDDRGDSGTVAEAFGGGHSQMTSAEFSGLLTPPPLSNNSRNLPSLWSDNV